MPILTFRSTKKPKPSARTCSNRARADLNGRNTKSRQSDAGKRALSTDLASSQCCRGLNHLDEKSAFRPRGRDLVEFLQQYGSGVSRQLDPEQPRFQIARDKWNLTVSPRSLLRGSVLLLNAARALVSESPRFRPTNGLPTTREVPVSLPIEACSASNLSRALSATSLWPAQFTGPRY
jgi:hypothetical protein